MGRGLARLRSSSGWAGGLSRQSRKHRPPIHWERSLELTIHWENEEDVMGRLVVGTGEEVGGKACFFIVFSTFLVALGKKNRPKSQQKSKPKKKPENTKKVTTNRLASFRSWEAKMDPKRTQNWPGAEKEQPKKSSKNRVLKRLICLPILRILNAPGP